MRYLPIPSGKDLETLKIIKEDYLEYNQDSEFSMGAYGAMSGKNHIHECDTVGCAIGNCVRIPRLSPIKTDFEFFTFRYERYQSRIIPDIYSDRRLPSINLWDFLFSSHWAEFNNTIQGFLERLDLVLEGAVPTNWDYSDYISYNLN